MSLKTAARCGRKSQKYRYNLYVVYELYVKLCEPCIFQKTLTNKIEYSIISVSQLIELEGGEYCG